MKLKTTTPKLKLTIDQIRDVYQDSDKCSYVLNFCTLSNQIIGAIDNETNIVGYAKDINAELNRSWGFSIKLAAMIIGWAGYTIYRAPKSIFSILKCRKKNRFYLANPETDNVWAEGMTKKVTSTYEGLI